MVLTDKEKKDARRRVWTGGTEVHVTPGQGAAGVIGFFLRPANWLERLLLIGAGVCPIIPQIATDIIGAGARAVAILSQRRGAARVHLALPPLFGSKKRSNSQ